MSKLYYEPARRIRRETVFRCLLGAKIRSSTIPEERLEGDGPNGSRERRSKGPQHRSGARGLEKGAPSSLTHGGGPRRGVPANRPVARKVFIRGYREGVPDARATMAFDSDRRTEARGTLRTR